MLILTAGGEGSEKRAQSAAGREFPGVSVCVPALGSPRRYLIIQFRVASLSNEFLKLETAGLANERH